MHDLALVEQGQFVSFCVFFGAICCGFITEVWPRSHSFGMSVDSRENLTDGPVNNTDNAAAYDQSNLFSRVWFSFMDPTIMLGYRRTLEENDILNMMPGKIRTIYSYRLVSLVWESHLQDCKLSNKTPSLLWVVLKTGGWSWAPILFAAFAESIMEYIQPILLDNIIGFISSYSTTDPQSSTLGVILAIGMFAAAVLASVASGQFSQKSSNLGLEIKSGLTSVIYRKSLKLSPSARRTVTVGEIANHMSVDAERVGHALSFLPWAITSPFEIAVAMWLLYRQLGPSTLTGLGVVFLLIPVQTLIAKVLNNAKDKKLEAMDGRIRLLTDILSGIKAVKLYSWEQSFGIKLGDYRKIELKHLAHVGTATALMMIMYSSLPPLMALLSFGVYAVVGGSNGTNGAMSAQVVFVSITLFNRLSKPIGRASEIIGEIISFNVAAKRIQGYLLQEEIDDCQIQHHELFLQQPESGHSQTLPNVKADDIVSSASIPSIDNNPNVSIHVHNGTFLWATPDLSLSSEVIEEKSDSKLPRPTLSNINLRISNSSLTAVVGRVGHGKSSLLSAIIGDMYKQANEGVVRINGSIAYVAQEAWIMNRSVKDNILFGKPLDQEHYQRVLHACSLLQDLHMLPAGDQTEIGERGINLSGGQKQRVSLARAAYQDADIYLLDDPLSAVDAHVDRHLWCNLIGPQGLLKDKTRILVTHGIHHLSEVDHIVVLKDGMIEEQGDYQTLMSAKELFYQIIDEYSVKGKKTQEAAGAELVSDDNIFVESEASCSGGEIKSETEGLINDGLDHGGGNAGLVMKEDAAEGNVGWNVFKIYCKASAVRLGLTYGFKHGLHKKVKMDNLRAGRVVNRFSSDIDNVDELVPYCISDFLYFLTTVLGILIVISVSLPLFLALVPFIVIVYFALQSLYMKSSRQLKRIHSISKSPMYQHFSETLTGVSTIRAMRAHERFIHENSVKLDRSANANFAYEVVVRWLHIRLEFLGAIIILATALLAVLKKETLGPDKAGLVLSYAVNAMFAITYLVKSFSELQNQLISVERIHEYSLLNQEAPEKLPDDDRLPPNWPSEGRIAFKNYSTRYREGLNLVLDDVSFEIQPSEKIGVVGRTGAGKSSLTLALFRIVEAANSQWAIASNNRLNVQMAEMQEILIIEKDPSEVKVDNDGGSIEIDGIDISTIGLETLRQHLAIIPQDPTLFSGTIRDNLDPFDQASDVEVWEALERAHLKSHIDSLEGGLSFEVAQNGENFSVGQRSLICLARALLRKTKILVLDEATAAVDVETDELIQKTIRKEFKDRTILTIAHRIKTIMDSDKILVLEKGQVQEYDTPKALLSKKGLFYSLAEQAGEVLEALNAMLHSKIKPASKLTSPSQLVASASTVSRPKDYAGVAKLNTNDSRDIKDYRMRELTDLLSERYLAQLKQKDASRFMKECFDRARGIDPDVPPEELPTPRPFASRNPVPRVTAPGTPTIHVCFGNMKSAPLGAFKADLRTLHVRTSAIPNIAFIGKAISVSNDPNITPELRVKLKENYAYRLAKIAAETTKPVVREVFLQMMAAANIPIPADLANKTIATAPLATTPAVSVPDPETSSDMVVDPTEDQINK
ncbi:Multidrug resistance-associated protein 1 [Entomortierella lignicola]|nr:Multidrug resistance-associated protein 1 [Entomortierella lignicola]